MPLIILNTKINAPMGRFDLARSIDLHKISTAKTNEEAIAGVTSGLIGAHECVTWRARHLGITQKLTSCITAFEPPHSFVDEMQQGIFKQFRHEHLFSEHAGITEMQDRFDYTAPLGILGRMVDATFLKTYMTQLLAARNQVIKEFAESKRWQEVLPQ